MKRSDIKVGAELALSTSNDWADSPYRISKVTVADTRGFAALRSFRGGAERPPLALEDGTQIRGDFYRPDTSKSTCLVRNSQGEIRLVTLASLRGDYATCEAQATVRDQARREAAARLEQARQTNRQRVSALAAALKAMGVPVGFVSEYAEQITLGPAALEVIVSLLTDKAV